MYIGDFASMKKSDIAKFITNIFADLRSIRHLCGREKNRADNTVDLLEMVRKQQPMRHSNTDYDIIIQQVFSLAVQFAMKKIRLNFKSR